MKKTLLIALLLTLSAGMAMAQQQFGPESGPGGKNRQGNFQAGNGGNPGSPVERLTERLGLDEAQAAEVAIIFEEALQLRNEERERVRVIFDEIRENTHARVLEVLSPEQQTLFEEQRRNREQLRQALEDVRGFDGYGARQGRRSCDG
ncbi:MAG: hypothetical protein WBM36_06570 [Lysobacterales bacterium]|jgi:Spy/CpxP family protein refolding chaperone